MLIRDGQQCHMGVISATSHAWRVSSVAGTATMGMAEPRHHALGGEGRRAFCVQSWIKKRKEKQNE